MNIVLSANSANFSAGMSKARSEVSDFNRSADSASSAAGGLTSVLSSGISTIATWGAAIAAAGAAAGVGLVGYGVKLASDYEQATITLSTMLGSADRAKELLKDLSKTAAATPFELPELVTATKKLVAFGVAQGEVIPTLTRLGDVAAGLGVPFAELADLYGKNKVQGRIMTEDLNQYSGRGINVLGELAKQFKVNEATVRKYAEEGKISFSDIELAFKNMAGEGGKFFGLMAAQSKSLAGLFSTASDTVGQSLMGIGQTVIESFDLKGALSSSTTALQAIGDALQPVVKSLADSLSDMGFRGENAGTLLVSSLETVSTAVAYVLDAVDALDYGWRTWQATIGNVSGFAVYSLAKILDAVKEVINSLNSVAGTDIPLPQTQGIWDVHMGLRQVISDNQKALDQLTGSKSHVDRTAAYWRDVRRRMAEPVETSTSAGPTSIGADFGPSAGEIESRAKATKDAIDDLQKSIDQFGLTAAGKKVFDLKKLGASPEQVAQVQKLADQLAGLEAAKKSADERKKLAEKTAADQKKLHDDMVSDAKRVIDANRTPVEKFREDILDLQRLLKAGALDPTTFDRASKKAEKEALQGLGSLEVKRVSAEERRFTFRVPQLESLGDPLAVAKQQLKEQQKQREAQEALNRKLGAGTQLAVYSIKK